MLRLTPTAVFDTYWRFAAERQAIFYRRLRGHSPVTEDPILLRFKFTNAYRASDRVSQYLIRNVIYRDDSSTEAEEVVFRILLFKLFNKIATWERLQHTLGPITYRSFSHQKYDAVLSAALARGERIYSSAYIMPPAGQLGHAQKHRNHLDLIDMMMRTGLTRHLARSSSMQDAYELLLGYPSLGPFLAYQFAIDLNYSEVTDFSEDDFVVAGPGARDGIRKCFGDSRALNDSELIRLLVDRQEEEFSARDLKFETLWGRRLHLIDCQNLLCETDKYARVAHPDVLGHTGRTRIKQTFTPQGFVVSPWYPPKWGLNDRIAAEEPSHAGVMMKPMRLPRQTTIPFEVVDAQAQTGRSLSREADLLAARRSGKAHLVTPREIGASEATDQRTACDERRPLALARRPRNARGSK